ncbi:spore germination protein [Paenibacillus thermoaerophilus]|uniref:Spore germination protein n=1 Tax=Paenibacillus thermoaerophilus TaxID=1215385 RepID=A0ABW2V643_9BACL|nr:spore germination protein [Paenibacillus thermoaerophilus]TMV12032.1 spore germination protein [Paenibacillus thermoaerophilus]
MEGVNQANDRRRGQARLSIDELKKVPLTGSIDDNRAYLEQLLSECSDAVIREFRIQSGPRALVVYIDGLAKTEAVDRTMQALMILEGGESDLERLIMTTLPVSQLNPTYNFGDLLANVLSGDTGLLVDGNASAMTMGYRDSEHRSVSEPETESVIRGPREGFTENLRTNTSMIRRKIRSPNLKMKPLIVGRETNTNIVVSYMDGIADPELVREVITRIESIRIDGVLETGYIEELIQDNGYSPFSQAQYTERPDTVAASLLEGRVAILVDGTPFVLLVPIVFWQWFQASEDYYERFMIGTLLRILRLIFFVVALTTPAIYIAVTTYHQEMIPTNLLLSIATSREPIPFPAVVEAMIMEVAFEALREAGIRLPRTVGQAVSILGALVVGQAAVQAGIVSAAMVIVVSLTGIASFTLPRFNGAISIRMLRFPLMILAAAFGLMGIVIGGLLILGHMAKLRSFGIPFLSPVSPLHVKDLKDVIYRAPWWNMRDRPRFLRGGDKRRFGRKVSDRMGKGKKPFRTTVKQGERDEN